MTSRWMRFVDREEQYGRHIVDAFARTLSHVRQVCDLGVGWGGDLDIVARHFPEAELHGVDCSASRRDVLHARNIRVHVLDLEREVLPFAPDSLDLIIANQVFEHLKDLFWVCHQISATLRMGGYLLLGVPNICALHNRLLFLAGHQPSQMKSSSAHVRGFGPKELPRFLDSCFPKGFELRRFAAAQFYPFAPPLARRLCALAPSLGHSVFYLLRKTRPYTNEFLDYPRQAGLETNFFTGETPAPRLDHAAIWARDLDALAAFYTRYFGATAGNKYTNARGFSSYFLSFRCGARLELMHMDAIPDNANDPLRQATGLIHLAIGLGSAQDVDRLTTELRNAGVRVLDGPRHTGDGYYESTILDPEGNRIEITA